MTTASSGVGGFAARRSRGVPSGSSSPRTTTWRPAISAIVAMASETALRVATMIWPGACCVTSLMASPCQRSTREDAGMIAIGRLHHVIYDTPDPMGLARFWSAVLGQPITYASGDFAVVAPHEDHSGLAFQLAPDHQPPVWGDP